MPESDDELAARVVAGGDRRAFAVLVNRHQSLVRGMLARLTGRSADADDLAQETFVQAWRRIATYRGQGGFRSWLCQIAYSRFLMNARKDRSRARLMEAAAREPEPEAPGSGHAGERLDLDRALAGLSQDERACIVLCHGAGLSHSEAADITGLALGTVKSHVNRGRAKLKAWYEEREKAA
ncbi:MAG: RNA polymerase sigma factor [Caulobacterales bacterium]|uniref:RNA polymerase sigma factor n=1 Tax=Glycocaulis sp. TaxID=1969725 RepID=UPI003FA02084